MRFHPTPRNIYYLSITLLLVFGFTLSCSKDTDILREAILEHPVTPEDKDTPEAEESGDEEEVEDEAGEVSEEETTESEEEEEEVAEDQGPIEEGFESRSTTFIPKYDAHLENGKGFNQSLIRLDSDRRTSYLLFDLSPIDSLGGVPYGRQTEVHRIFG